MTSTNSRRPPAASSPGARARMSVTRTKDTPSELLLRRQLYRRGLRYRVHAIIVPGSRCRPDVVVAKARVAIFVDGCFWHGCPQHRTWPKANRRWWRDKLRANENRDRRIDRELRALGWHVIRIWEHADMAAAAQHAAGIVASRLGRTECDA
jgi:DNA mismatch endonuclease, patch repair protein